MVYVSFLRIVGETGKTSKEKKSTCWMFLQRCSHLMCNTEHSLPINMTKFLKCFQKACESFDMWIQLSILMLFPVFLPVLCVLPSLSPLKIGDFVLQSWTHPFGTLKPDEYMKGRRALEASDHILWSLGEGKSLQFHQATWLMRLWVTLLNS